MIRRSQAKGKIVRRLGVNIFEQGKYDRLLKKKNYAPGMHGRNKRRTKLTDYGRHLLEKQKLQFAYGLTEKQVRNAYLKAKKLEGVTGDNLLMLLERRIDNIIYRLGLASSRNQARQIVSHGHIHLNGKKIDIPSILISKGDKISVRSKEGSSKMLRENLSRNSHKTIPSWLEFKADDLEAIMLSNPQRTEIAIPVDEQLIIAFYSK